MTDQRKKDMSWYVVDKDGASFARYDAAMLAVLLDLRDELKTMNAKLSVLQCPSVVAIPRVLRTISRNTNRKKKPPVRLRRVL